MKRKHLGIGLGVAAAFAAIAFVIYRWRTSGFAWREFAAALSHVDWSWLALSLPLVLGTYVGRALRWKVMLQPLLSCSGAKASLSRLFSATAIGFTAVVLFGRAGEPVRPYLIAKKESVSFSSQVAVWIVERMLDLLMVLVIFGIALGQISRSAIPHGPRVQVVLEAGGYTAGLAGAICLALLIGLARFRGRVQARLMEALSFLPETLAERIERTLASFSEGMESMRSGSTSALLVLYTVLEWCVIAAAFGCVLKAFPATHGLGIADVVILLGFVAFGSVLQIPGVGGGMQIATVLVLTEFFGVTLEAASGIALVLWLITFVIIVPVGFVLAFREGIKWRNLRHIEPSSQANGAGAGGAGASDAGASGAGASGES